MTIRKYLLSALAGAGVLAAHAPAANAQEQEAQSGSLLEEIVVTAQRREEKLQEVPVAVTAFSDVQLERLNITQTLDLVQMIPNFIGHNNTGLGSANTYALRGLSNTESIATFDAPVGTYVDDVFIARQNANNFAFFDMDRIEVLRGPQGVTFGRNTTGGAINVILKEPGEEVGGFAEAGFGSWGRTKVRGSVDLPVNEQMSTKVSGYFIKEDGYATNLGRNGVSAGDRVNGVDSVGARIATKIKAADNVTWNLALSYVKDKTAHYGDYDIDGHRYFRTPLSENSQTFANFTQLVGTTPVFMSGKKRFFTGGNDATSKMVTSNIRWETGIGQVSFITGYYDLHHEYALDFLASFSAVAPDNLNISPFGSFVLVNDSSHKEFTQEIKLAGTALENKIDYVAGLYYFNEQNLSDWADIFLGGMSADRTLDNDTDATAAYFQGNWHLTDAFTFTAGARYTHERKAVSIASNQTLIGTTLNNASLVANNIPLSQSVGIVTPRVALKYEVNPDLNFYASATRGFKSGGWNARSTSAASFTTFKPEKVWSYELGMRSDWLDNRLRFNATAFRTDIDDYQLPGAFTPPGATAPVFITGNPAGFQNTGVEIELAAQPVENLNVFVNAGWQDAKYKDLSAGILAQQAACRAVIAAGTSATSPLCANGIVNPNGDISTPVRAPDTTVTIGANYTFHVGSMKLTPSFTFRDVGDLNVATSEVPFAAPVTVIGGRTFRNLTPSDNSGAEYGGYSMYDIGLLLAPEDGDWSIQATCDNCGNEAIVNSSLINALYLDAPRSWTVTARYKF